MSTAPLRVIVVEDESLLAMMIETVLVSQGMKVVANVGSVGRALDAVRQHDFDVALLDVNVGGTDVYPVAEAILAQGQPLIFVTGYGGEGIRPDLQHLPVITKPFVVDHLLRTVRAVARDRTCA